MSSVRFGRAETPESERRYSGDLQSASAGHRSRPASGHGRPVALVAALLFLASVLVGLSPASASTDVITETKLTAGDAAGDDQFGSSVATYEDTAIVGSAQDDDDGALSGSAYVYLRSGTTWTQEAKLTADDAAAGDEFGTSVAIYGDTAVVGAPLHGDTAAGSGAVYVFTRSGTTWTQQAKLVASNAALNDAFGTTVAISGDSIAVGAVATDGTGAESGSVYVFTRSGTTWTEEQEIVASDAAAGDSFGVGVSIDADTVVAGANFNDATASDAGSAYVFTRSGTTWTEEAILTASDGAADDQFGGAVGLAADTVVVGSALDDDTASATGSAYVFTRSGSTWTEEAKLTASNAAVDDMFGTSVAVSRDGVVVGAIGTDGATSNSGSTYLFERDGTTWMESAEIVASDAAADDAFGSSVALYRSTAIVGSPLDDDDGSESGSAYMLDMPSLVKSGYWMLESAGPFYEFGDSPAYAAATLASGVSMVGFDRRADGDGLWALDSSGVVHVRGSATNFGDVDLDTLSTGETVASISATPSGLGYWVFTDLGRALTFGDAVHFDDLPGLGLVPNGSIVASAPTATGNGYYMLGSDGGVFSFGDAAFKGSIPQVLPAGSLVCPIVGLVPTPTGDGYWMVACDGGVFAFGDAVFQGSVPGVLPEGVQLNSPINGLVPYGNGYLMVAADGGVFTFSDRDFLGSLGDNPPDSPIVAIAAFVS
jgi:FG-GAP repeat